MEQTYRLEFNEEQQFFNLHDGNIEENTHGWFTILKNCTVSDFEVYERYVNCVKQKKLTKKYLLKCASELKGFGNTFNQNYARSMTSANPFEEELDNQGLI